MRINKHDTNGTKPLLGKGELGYDDYPAGGDVGRVFVGTGTENICLAKKVEVVAVDSKSDTHIGRTDNPHSVTKAQIGLGNVDNTADAGKNVLSASKLTTARNIALTGDVTGNVTFDGSAGVSITTTIAANSVALGTDTTGNYVAGVTAGTGITVGGTAGEGWTPSVAITNVGTAGTYTKVTTNAQGQVTNGATLSAGDIPSLDASKITSGVIDAARLPAYVDDVLEFANLVGFPVVGETGKIYVALDTNKSYRWSGSAYIYITSGAVDSVAGKTGVVTLVKADVGLSNVDNTSDANKPISTATQTALDLKANRASPALTGAPTAPTAVVGTSNTVLATTAFVNAEIANDTYSKTQLDAGQLDNRYYTEAEVDSKLAANEITVTDNAIARYNGTTGKLQNSGVIIDDNGNVGISDSAPQYKLSIGPSAVLHSTAGSKITAFSKSTNVGNASFLRFDTVRTSAGSSHESSEERIRKVIDVTEMGYIGFGDDTVKLGTGSGDKVIIDASGNVLLTSATGGLGYGAGAGGTVTQLTSKSTSVTLNKPTGQIVTSNSALAAGAIVGFTLNNSLLTGNDTVKVIVGGTGAAGAYQVDCTYCINGTVRIIVKNIDTVSRTDVVAINFTVIKGANS